MVVVVVAVFVVFVVVVIVVVVVVVVVVEVLVGSYKIFCYNFHSTHITLNCYVLSSVD